MCFFGVVVIIQYTQNNGKWTSKNITDNENGADFQNENNPKTCGFNLQENKKVVDINFGGPVAVRDWIIFAV